MDPHNEKEESEMLVSGARRSECTGGSHASGVKGLEIVRRRLLRICAST